ncbi:AAA family ATPase [Herbaspirillum sp. RV1423]|uniref:AAA family ATPase n=1 Tax=Herbaspirillum sp. RV1423 TaxID=1443993 RepID=UPI0004AD5B07|nr:AAA family ATPase [Herbaspirillum sp. RV1423]
MQLTSVSIHNFRSIKYEHIQFTQDRARVLVGINESGKSNVLKALALLSKEEKIDVADKRVEKNDEEPIQDSDVFFRFSLTEEEIRKVYELVAIKFNTKDLVNPIIIFEGRTLTLKEFCDLKSGDGLYLVDIINSKRYSSFYSTYNSEIKIHDGWRKRNTTSDNDSTLENSPIFFHSKSELASPTEFTDLLFDDIETEIGREIGKMVAAQLPECLYWRYEEQNLLPGQVDMESFQSNPDSCIPLKNCFEMAGYANPGEVLQKARQKTRQNLLNLLQNVSQKTTSYVRSVWKDHKDISIEFHPDGGLILPIVKDQKINFDFLQRSEAFKRFISFLLLISTKVSTKKISNTLILIDEPEIGLHPTGARNLMGELIKISQSNYVVYSTHSIFMIDKENIGRHLIVEKKEEITTLSDAETSKIQDEEVIYKAIGFSLMEILKPKNLLFEGWRDKKLFQISKEKYLKQHASNKDILEADKNISICHAEGVKDVRNIAPLIELALRKLLIVTDSDAPAKEQKKRHMEAKMYGEWLTYEDLTGNSSFITSEDFINSEIIIEKLKILKNEFPNLPELTLQDLSDRKGKLHAIEKWINSKVQLEEKPRVLNQSKALLFDNLLASEILDEYQLVLDHIYKLAHA